MNAHQLDDNGVILNTIVVDDLDVIPNLVDASIGGSIGDSIIGGTVVPKPVSAPSRDDLKAARQAQVDAIAVTVNGKVFDGDETSQERMARALRVADITGQTSCTWVLHDNTAVTVTRDELAQALSLAMQAQGAMWVIP